MKYNKNMQVSFIDNITKLKMWNKTYTLSGREKVFNLIIELLNYCEENRSEEEIKDYFINVPSKFLDKIINFLISNNIVTNNFVNEENKKMLSQKLVMYLERNYSNININDIAKQIINLHVDIYSFEDEYLDIKNSFNNIGITEVYRGIFKIDDKKSNKLAILDASKLDKGEMIETYNLFMKKYNQVYAIFGLRDKVVGTSMNNNILNFYESDFNQNFENSNAYKVLYLLLAKLTIDSFVCNSDETNVIEVDSNLSVKRYSVPRENIDEFNEKYVIKLENELNDIQIDVNNLYSMMKNEKNIIQYLGYKSGNQMSFITIETRIRDLIHGESLSFYSSGEDFTSASIKSITNALKKYLSRLIKTKNEFVVVEYGYNNYKDMIITQSAFNILEKKCEIKEIDINSQLKNRLKYLEPFINLDKIKFECVGNDEYSVYKVKLITENDIDEMICGNNVYEAGKDLLFDYIGRERHIDSWIGNLEDVQEEKTENVYVEGINNKSIDLIKESNIKIIEGGWSYNKYFNKINIFVAKVKMIMK